MKSFWMRHGDRKDSILLAKSFADSTGIDPDILKIIGIFGSVFLCGDLNGDVLSNSVFYFRVVKQSILFHDHIVVIFTLEFTYLH